jgi:hypothetical protein
MNRSLISKFFLYQLLIGSVAIDAELDRKDHGLILALAIGSESKLAPN